MRNRFKFIEIEDSGDLAFVKLNRTENGNALHAEMIEELIRSFKVLEAIKELRFIVISGNGKSFCSGADLQWMANAINLSEEENYIDALQLANLFWVIYSSSKITLSMVHGACLGGGVGIAAACDRVIAGQEAYFSFTEVRLGLVPATISPYIINRMGASKVKNAMLTGEILTAQKALELGLVDELALDLDSGGTLMSLIDKLRKGGPFAQREIKKLLHIQNNSITNEIKEQTARLIAQIRTTPEAKEGMKAFFEKRNPNWLY